MMFISWFFSDKTADCPKCTLEVCRLLGIKKDGTGIGRIGTEMGIEKKLYS